MNIYIVMKYDLKSGIRKNLVAYRDRKKAFLSAHRNLSEGEPSIFYYVEECRYGEE